MHRFYHVHYDTDYDETAVNWFETMESAWRFMRVLDEQGIPTGYPVGSEDKCRICDWKV